MSTAIPDSNTIYPAMTNMIVEADDIQLIIDDFRKDDRRRITADGIFTHGIVNRPDEYLQRFVNPNTGAVMNSIRINPFTAYTRTGNRIEVAQPFVNLSPIGSSITVTSKNTYSSTERTPLWVTDTVPYSIIPTDIDANLFKYSFVIHTLGAGSVLHGIKLSRDQMFAASGDVQPDVSVAIGIFENGGLNETKFMPYTSVSSSDSDYDNTRDINSINLLYAIDEDEATDIYMTIRSNIFLASSNFNAGLLKVSFCIADFNQNTNVTETTSSVGLSLDTSSESTWEGGMRYYIVARYSEQPDKNSYRSLSYRVNNVDVETVPEPTRIIPYYSFYALRRSGSSQDVMTDEDVKLGEVQTDSDGNITGIYVNGLNLSGERYTDYLNLPGYRFLENIDASQIADGTVSDRQFQYLNTLTGNVQTQLAGKAGLIADNVFTGTNTFRNTISADCTSVNGFSASREPVPNTIPVLGGDGRLPESVIPSRVLVGAGRCYCVNSARRNSNGRPDFLEMSDTLTSVIVRTTTDGNVPTPLDLVYSDGTQETITEDFNIDGISEGSYYLVKEKDVPNGTALPMGNSGTVRYIQAVDNDCVIYDWMGFTGTSSLGRVSCSTNPSNAYMAFNPIYRSIGVVIGGVSYTNSEGVSNTMPSTAMTYGYMEIRLDTPLRATMATFNFFRQPVDEANIDAFPRTVSVVATNDVSATLSDLSGWTVLVDNYAIGTDWDNTDIFVTIPSNVRGDFVRYALYFSYGATEQGGIFSCSNISLGRLNGEQVEGSIYDGVVRRDIVCTSFSIYGGRPDTLSLTNTIREGLVLPATALAGDYFLDTSAIPFRGLRYDGEGWVSCDFVRLGTVSVTDNGGGSPTIVLGNACTGTSYISDPLTVESMTSDATLRHNMGIVPRNVSIRYVCTSAGNGYSVGDTTDGLYVSTSGSSPTYLRPAVTVFGITDISLSYRTYNASSEGLFILDRNTGTVASATSSWAVVIMLSRGY